MTTLFHNLNKEVIDTERTNSRALGVIGEVITEVYLSDNWNVTLSDDIFDSYKDMVIQSKSNNTKYIIECKTCRPFYKEGYFSFSLNQKQKLTTVDFVFILENPLPEYYSASLYYTTQSNILYYAQEKDNKYIIPINSCSELFTIDDKEIISLLHKYS